MPIARVAYVVACMSNTYLTTSH